MVLHKNLVPFVVSTNDSLRTALAKIEKNKHKLVYVVDEKNHLIGCLADGDFRRWSLIQTSINLETPVIQVCNLNCRSESIDVNQRDLHQTMTGGLSSLPLVDAAGHLVAIAQNTIKFITIDNKRISAEDPTYIIAEVGNNHQGDMTLAKQLVDVALAAKVDCVKFQMRSMDALYREKGIENEDIGTQYTIDLLNKYQLCDQHMFEVFNYCQSKGITPLCTPWDIHSLEKLEAYGMKAYKVASADFTNYPLLEAIAATGKPMICSTGMSTEDEIRQSIEFLERHKAQFILLHCNSTYPTPFKDINLAYLPKLQELSQWVVGYSGHERGWSIPIAAVALGVKVIEKHITLDVTLEGNDHKVSLLPDELAAMTQDIRNVELAKGNTQHSRVITQGEMINREVLAKSLVAKQAISKGSVIEHHMVSVKSPGRGVQPNRLSELLGKVSNRDIEKGDFFYDSDINGLSNKKSRYQYSRPYGVPVRYHDFNALKNEVELDFVEFHLSYNDLSVVPNQFISPQTSIDLAVHAPELFANDHLLDLSSFDDQYRQHSIEALQGVINHTRILNELFPKTRNPVLVLNAGGWSTDTFLDANQVALKYDLVADALGKVDDSGVIVAIQTMPPFPWHFGGQSHHNLFVEPLEIRTFCERTGAKVCLDISHSMMACNHNKTDLYEFIKIVGPYVVHLHIVDASGLDGEGVELGKGDVDFARLGKMLEEFAPNIPFIPEVWQGHKNNGEGFWQALDYLESKIK
ncbi:N-acetylneuraminate synthase family protein [Paraglaciecola sp.]|uniref:N-acetylneuraminate synthase family protein n=1 Tax=Paraglaciecola sp. TaxID=1920173 RepID=UPI0032631850